MPDAPLEEFSKAFKNADEDTRTELKLETAYRRKKSWVVLGIITVLLVAIIGLGYYAVSQKKAEAYTFAGIILAGMAAGLVNGLLAASGLTIKLPALKKAPEKTAK